VRAVKPVVRTSEFKDSTLWTFDPLYSPLTSKPKNKKSEYLRSIRLGGNSSLQFRHTPYSVENYFRAWVLRLPEGHPHEADPYAFLGSLGVLMKRKITGDIVAMRGVKFQLALMIRFRKERYDGGEVVAQPIFYSRQQASLRATDIDAALTEATGTIQRAIEEYTRDGSGWAVDRVVELYINIAGVAILTSLQPSKAERQSSISRTMTTTVLGGPSSPADTLQTRTA
jgi:hypothetical protein